jgi:hypothetical protein
MPELSARATQHLQPSPELLRRLDDEDVALLEVVVERALVRVIALTRTRPEWVQSEAMVIGSRQFRALEVLRVVDQGATTSDLAEALDLSFAQSRAFLRRLVALGYAKAKSRRVSAKQAQRFVATVRGLEVLEAAKVAGRGAGDAVQRRSA